MQAILRLHEKPCSLYVPWNSFPMNLLAIFSGICLKMGKHFQTLDFRFRESEMITEEYILSPNGDEGSNLP